MVKLDYDRNYYADLELSGTEDAVEVKKQFKKLGRFLMTCWYRSATDHDCL